MNNINWHSVGLWTIAIIILLAVNTGTRLALYHIFDIDALWINVVVSIFWGIVLGIVLILIVVIDELTKGRK